jgi:hypothetical protein
MAFFDIENTKRKLSEHGVEVEMNGFIRKLVAWMGLDYGVAFGILVPTWIILGLGWYVPSILTFCLGARFTLFLFQLKAYHAD